ncbi:MAG: radical SAM protein [Bacteroidaceae bacterium]|nr:radical SAM protein [Bacteroidaceae bacterium]
MSRISQFLYLPCWFVGARFLGKKKPLQSVIFISDKCNLSCKHCSVYNHTEPKVKTFEQLVEEMKYCYSLGSRFIDFEGGEPFIWEDNGRTVDDLCDEAKRLGFFSCTITTNAQKPFPDSHADSIWVSLDGVGDYHERVRGKGTFARLEQNIATCRHKALSANMAINTLNWEAVAETIEYVKKSPYFKSISFSFHTPFAGTEYLALDQEHREQVLDVILAYKKKGYPIMNTAVGLRKMKKLDFKPECWVTNFIFSDGTRKPQCIGAEQGVCDKCGFGMAGEMNALFHFSPETILAGLKLRM